MKARASLSALRISMALRVLRPRRLEGGLQRGATVFGRKRGRLGTQLHACWRSWPVADEWLVGQHVRMAASKPSDLAGGGCIHILS